MARSIYERAAQKDLEKQNYLVDYKHRPRFAGRGYQTDYFGAFDLMAYKAGDPLRLISIKGKAGVPSDHRKLLESFVFSEGIQKEIWVYSKGKKVEPRKEII